MMFYLLIFAACIQLSLQPNQTKCKECRVGIIQEVNVLPRNKSEFMEFTKKLSCQCNCSSVEEPTYLHYAPSSTANKTYIVCDYKQPLLGYCLEYNEGGKILQPNNADDCTKHKSPCNSSYMSTDSYLHPQCFKNGGLQVTEEEKAQKDNCTYLENESKENSCVLYALIPSCISLIIGIFIGHCLSPWITKCVSLFKENSESEDSAVASRSPPEQIKLSANLSVALIKSSCVDLPPEDSNKSKIFDSPQDEQEEFLLGKSDMKCIEQHAMNDMNVSPACEKNPLLDAIIDIEN